MRTSFRIILAIFFLVPFGLFAQNEPHAFYLTWVDNPTKSMAIDWHLDEDSPSPLYFRQKGRDNWKSFESDLVPYPFSERWVHRVFLMGLRPDTSYEIKFSEEGKIYYFNTMPRNLKDRPLNIAIGGDSMHRKEWFEKTNRVVASHEPDFVIIGGDMAYENGLPEKLDRIYDWFDAYSNTLVLEDGRILPCIVAIGNHEVVGGYHTKYPDYQQNNPFRARIAPYFYSLFAFPGQPGYNVLDFGKYLSLVILDTEHSNPIEGVQTDWLEETLSKRKRVNHIIPIYHVPGYPSVREYDDRVQTLVRDVWTPIFEDHGIKIAFENHDHAYKRTFPIKNQQVDDEGIIYVGDGSWGVAERPIHEVEETWYLEVAQSIRAFTLLTLTEDGFSFISIDEEGQIIDRY